MLQPRSVCWFISLCREWGTCSFSHSFATPL